MHNVSSGFADLLWRRSVFLDCTVTGAIDSDEGKMHSRTVKNYFSECGALNLWDRLRLNSLVAPKFGPERSICLGDLGN